MEYVRKNWLSLLSHWLKFKRYATKEVPGNIKTIGLHSASNAKIGGGMIGVTSTPLSPSGRAKLTHGEEIEVIADVPISKGKAVVLTQCFFGWQWHVIAL